MWVATCLFVFYSFWWYQSLALHWSYVSLPTSVYVHSFLPCLLMLPMFHYSACMFSPYVTWAIIWLLNKSRRIISLTTIQNVLSLNHHHMSVWLMMSIFLVPYFWSQPSLFDAWYFTFIVFWVYLTLWSCYHHLQACHFFDNLKFVSRVSSDPCRDGLLGIKDWFENSRTP